MILCSHAIEQHIQILRQAKSESQDKPQAILLCCVFVRSLGFKLEEL